MDLIEFYISLPHHSTSINLHQPPSTYINLHQPSSTFISLHKMSSTFINLNQPSSTFINLHQPSTTFIILHQPSSTFIIIMNWRTVELRTENWWKVWQTEKTDGLTYLELERHSPLKTLYRPLGIVSLHEELSVICKSNFSDFVVEKSWKMVRIVS